MALLLQHRSLDCRVPRHLFLKEPHADHSDVFHCRLVRWRPRVGRRRLYERVLASAATRYVHDDDQRL